MTNKRSKAAKIILVLVALALAAVIYLAIMIGPATIAGLQAREFRHQLLIGAEHKALLEACRVLSKQAITGELSPGTYWIRSRPRSAASEFPELIYSLRPAYVSIAADGVVRIEMGSRWRALGVYAYPDGYENRFPNVRYGDRELLHGLWYYDDNYLHVPAYDAEIDAILTEESGTRG